jgi:hypothetical protein
MTEVRSDRESTPIDAAVSRDDRRAAVDITGLEVSFAAADDDLKAVQRVTDGER